MAQFEIDFAEAFRQMAAFQSRLDTLGNALDKLQKDANKPNLAANKLIKDVTSNLMALEGALSGYAADMKATISTIDRVSDVAVREIGKIAAANLRLTASAGAYLGKNKELERLLADTSAKSAFVRWAEKTRNLTNELAGENKYLSAQIKALSTEEGRANLIRRATLASQSRMLTAAHEMALANKELKQQEELLSAMYGKSNAVLKARIAETVKAYQEETKLSAKLAEHQRAEESLTSGIRRQIVAQAERNKGLEQSITFTQREQNAVDELLRRQQSLNGGLAEQAALLKATNQAREKEVTEEARQAAKLAELERHLKSLNGGMAEQLVRIQQSIRERTKQIESEGKAKTAQKELTSEYEKAVQTLARLKEQREIAGSALGRETAAIRLQIAEQERYNRLVAMSTAELLGFTSAQKRAAAATSIGSQSAAMLRAGLSGLQTSIGMYTSSTIIAASSTYALAAALRGSVLLGAEFTATMAKADAVMSKGGMDWLTSSMGAMESQVRALGQTTIFTASEVAEGLVELGQAGLSSSEAITALKPALDLAQLGSISMAEASDVATNVMMTFGYKAKDLTMIVDEMAFAVSNSNTNIAQLANALTYAGPAAATAGISMRETIVAIETLSNSGIKASRAGTAMRRLFVSLLNPTEKGTRVLNQYGISVQDVEGKTRSLSDILGQLNTALSGVDEGKRLSAIQDLVGVYATSPVAALISSSAQFDKALRDHELMVEGSAERMRKLMENGLKFDWKQTVSAFQEVQLQFFDAFEMHLRDASARLTYYLNNLTLPSKAWNRETGQEVSVPDYAASRSAWLDAPEGAPGSPEAEAKQALEAKHVQDLTQAMTIMADKGNIVISQLDELIQRAKIFGETIAWAAGGFAAFKIASGVGGGVFGAMATDAKKVSERMGALSQKYYDTANAQAMVVAGAGRASSLLREQATAATVANASIGVLAGGMQTAANVAGALATGMNWLLRGLGWVGVIWGLYEAGKAFFGTDTQKEILAQKEKVDDLRASYDRLKETFAAYGLARERAALIEQNANSAQQLSDIEKRKGVLSGYLKIEGINKDSITAELAKLGEMEKELRDNIARTNSELDKRATTARDVGDANDRLALAAQALAKAEKDLVTATARYKSPYATDEDAQAYREAVERVEQLKEQVHGLGEAAADVSRRLETVAGTISGLATLHSEKLQAELDKLYLTPGQNAERARKAYEEAKANYAKAEAGVKTYSASLASLSEIQREEAEIRSQANHMLDSSKVARLQELSLMKQAVTLNKDVVVGQDELKRSSDALIAATEEYARTGQPLQQQIIAGNAAEEERANLYKSTTEKLADNSRALKALAEDERRLREQMEAGAISAEVFAEQEAANKQRHLKLDQERLSLQSELQKSEKKAGKKPAKTDEEKALEAAWKAYESIRKEADPLAASLANLAEKEAALTLLVTEGKISVSDKAQALAHLRKEHYELTLSQDKNYQSLLKLREEYGAGESALVKHAKELAELNRLYSAGAVSADEYLRVRQKINEASNASVLDGLPEAKLPSDNTLSTPFSDLMNVFMERSQGSQAFADREEQLTADLHAGYADINERFLAEKAALDATEKNAEEHQRRLTEIQSRYQGERKKLADQFYKSTDLLAENSAQYQEQMGKVLLSSMFGTAEALLSSFASASEDATGAQKAAFAAMKAFAVAQIMLNTEVAASKAMSAPDVVLFGQQIGAQTAIRAMGYASAGLVAGMAVAELAGGGKSSSSGGGKSYAGAFDDGGFIPYNSYGIVGEYGPEIVHGPANVTSRKESAKKLGGVGEYNITLSPQITVTTPPSSGGQQPSAADMKGLAAAVKNAVMSTLQEQMRPNGALDTWIRSKRG